MWLIKTEEETDMRYGKSPADRTIEELINTAVIILDKHAGPTSHQVTKWVKEIFQVSKAGHAGTLDPAVTGVLPVALGSAVKAMPVLSGLDKEYVGVMHLHHDVDTETLRKVIAEKFVGEIVQIPPVKSAVARRPRKRKVYFFDVLEKEGKDVLFKVGCEAGVYIRKLCVHGDTEIILSHGSIEKIKDLVENFTKNEGSFRVSSSIFTPSMDIENSETSNEKIVAVHKLQNKHRLIQITTESGLDIKVTPDHEILISTLDGPKWVSASSLKPGNFVYSPQRIQVEGKVPYIVDLVDDNTYVVDEPVRKICIDGLRKKFGSIRGMNRKLRIDRRPFSSKSKVGIKIKHIKLAAEWERVRSLIRTLKTEKGRAIRLRTRKVNKEIMYLLGLVAPDGCVVFEKKSIRPTRVKFHNKEKAIIDKFVYVYNKIFPEMPAKVKLFRNIFEVDVYNPVFANVAYNMGIKSPEKDRDFKMIFSFPEELIKSFLKGYFEGDGHVYFRKRKGKNYFSLCIIAGFYSTAKRIYQLLKRLGIRSRIYPRKVNVGFKSSEGYSYIVSIDSLKDKLKFVKEVGTDHPLKNRYFKRVLEEFGHCIDDIQEDYYVPLHIKSYIKSILEKNKTSLSDLSLGGNLYRVFKSRSPMTRSLLRRIIRSLSELSIDTKDLERELNSNFFVEKIKSVQEVKSEDFVYDITVDNLHNFIPEGCIVVSNCSDIGKALGKDAHMSELRRVKAGSFTEDQAHSLVEVKDAYEFWKGGEEKFLRKILLPVEYAIQHVKKVFVKDSAIDSICNGAPVYPKGLVRVQEGIVRGETVAVYSLKEELVALGIAKLTSEEMVKAKRGIAVRTDRVFMEKGVYPKVL